jgi:dihydroflavonol-4-reductase
LFGKKILLTKESARIANSTTYFDNSRILEALPGFQFTPLSTTIEKACIKYMGNNPGR